MAVYFSISERTVYRLIEAGDLKFIKLRDCVRISMEEIRKLEEKLSNDF